jgi:hypothetical protein
MWKILDNNFVIGKFDSLKDAMEGAKYYDEFVTITDGITEIVGRFGVDEVENKVLPDGTSYEWTMCRDENKSWRKKNM